MKDDGMTDAEIEEYYKKYEEDTKKYGKLRDKIENFYQEIKDTLLKEGTIIDEYKRIKEEYSDLEKLTEERKDTCIQGDEYVHNNRLKDVTEAYAKLKSFFNLLLK